MKFWGRRQRPAQVDGSLEAVEEAVREARLLRANLVKLVEVIKSDERRRSR